MAFPFFASWMTARHQITLSAIVLFFFASTFLLATRHPPAALEKRSLPTPVMDPKVDYSLVVLSAKLDVIEGTQIVWQIPVAPKAVLFIAHGCYCSPTFFWDKGPDCAECIGLPEERMLVTHALARSYAVVAISSTGKCWAFVDDKKKVRLLLNRWVKEQGLERLPVVALGASSGGYFVSSLAREMKFESVVIMISEGVFTTRSIGSDYPPTLFLHMPKDERRALLIQENMVMLKNKGVETAEIKCYEIPVTPQLFNKIPGIDSAISEKIYRTLKGNGIIDDNNFMKADGRSSSKWQMVLKNEQILPLESEGKLKWGAHLQELLNLAYGYHEMTSLQSDGIFAWFDSHLPKTAVSN